MGSGLETPGLQDWAPQSPPDGQEGPVEGRDESLPTPKEENSFRTEVLPHSGQTTFAFPKTSSEK